MIDVLISQRVPVNADNSNVNLRVDFKRYIVEAIPKAGELFSAIHKETGLKNEFICMTVSQGTPEAQTPTIRAKLKPSD